MTDPVRNKGKESVAGHEDGLQKANIALSVVNLVVLLFVALICYRLHGKADKMSVSSENDGKALSATVNLLLGELESKKKINEVFRRRISDDGDEIRELEDEIKRYDVMIDSVRQSIDSSDDSYSKIVPDSPGMYNYRETSIIDVEPCAWRPSKGELCIKDFYDQQVSVTEMNKYEWGKKISGD